MVTGRISLTEENIIIKMRNENKSYNEIAEVLNCKKDRVRYFCRRHGLNGVRSDKLASNVKPLKERENDFKIKFEEQNPDFTYLEGYDDCESIVKVQCNTCGNIEEKYASIIRGNKHYNRSLQCNNCLKIEKEKEKILIEKEKFKKKCIKDMKQILEKYISDIEYDEKLNSHVCIECGKTFRASRLGVKY